MPRISAIIGAALLASACSQHSGPSGDAPATIEPRRALPSLEREPALPKSPAVAEPDPPPVPPTSTCAGAIPTVCVARAGCILDQPAQGRYECRDARDACERAALHGEIINLSKPAEQRCATADGCEVAGGFCSCPCSVLGTCKCECGGNVLARCIRSEHAAVMNATPTKRFPPY